MTNFKTALPSKSKKTVGAKTASTAGRNTHTDKETSQEHTVMQSDLSSGMRWIARLILILVSFVWYSPHVHAAVDRITQAPALNRIENHYPLGAELEKLRSELKRYQASLEHVNKLSTLAEQARHDNGRHGNYDNYESNKAYQDSLNDSLKASFEALGRHAETVQELSQTIEALDDDQRIALDGNLEHLRASQQSTEVIARQAQVLANYEQHMDGLLANLDTLSEQTNAANVATQQVQVEQALDALSNPLSRPHESYSNDLDFIESAARAPYSQASQIDGLVGADAGNYLATDSATVSTTAIQDKVTELGSDPLSLYQWVYDTIRWIPSYGVMQGADYTLQTEQGNAFDTSSLLIALLREAGHEARYRYGLVNAPVDAMTNWVGDVKNAAAVMNLMGQGGIPQQGVSYGGAIEEIQFEHVWVEVKEGNNWIALDSSYKQYHYEQGLDLENAVAFDAQSLLTQLENTSTSNEAEGWVQGVDANLIQTELDNYQHELETYLNSNAPDATLGEVLGQQSILPNTANSLSDASDIQANAYAVQLSQVVDQLPETLFHRFRVQVGDTVSFDLGASFEWNQELFELNEVTTNLVGKDIALSFRPATEADEAVIESYLPEIIESAEDLPNTLPASNIQMVGELTIDGQVMYSTPEVTLGEALKTRLGFQAPQSAFRFTENYLIAGQYQAVGIDMQGISPTQLESLQSKLESTQAQLEADNTQSLTKHDVVGNIMQAGVQGYMAMTYATDRIAAQAAGVAYHRQPSYGTFSTEMQVSYLLTGTPNQVTFTGVVMDIDRLNNNVEDRKNCYEDWVAFNRASGMRNSAYEHQIPEQLFSTETEQAEGVSTAKALAIAMAEGQRVYTLTPENATQLNNITIDQGARDEIQTALGLGMEVTVHQSPINVNGWEGSGYAIIDPEYGVGAYKISGGASGGIVFLILTFVGALVALLGLLAASPLVTLLGATAMSLFGVGFLSATGASPSIDSAISAIAFTVAIIAIIALATTWIKLTAGANMFLAIMSLLTSIPAILDPVM